MGRQKACAQQQEVAGSAGWSIKLVWLFAAVLVLPCAGAPQEEIFDIHWEELRPLILNHRVRITDRAGSVSAGIVEGVTDSQIELRARPVAGGPQRTVEIVPRSVVQTIELRRMRGKSRAIWATTLGLAGAFLGVLIGTAETFGEDGGAVAVAATVAIATGGAAAGYGTERHRDKQTVLFRLVP